MQVTLFSYGSQFFLKRRETNTNSYFWLSRIYSDQESLYFVVYIL
jgi:hypothetical protein